MMEMAVVGWVAMEEGSSVVLGLKWRKFGKWFSVGVVQPGRPPFESEKMNFFGCKASCFLSE